MIFPMGDKSVYPILIADNYLLSVAPNIVYYFTEAWSSSNFISQLFLTTVC